MSDRGHGPDAAAMRPPTRQAWLEADWPAPPGVRALATLRHGAGASMRPFDRFNLGNARGDAGDDPIVVAANRAELTLRAGLPSAPVWLRQVHGTRVLRVDEPLPEGDASAERRRMADEPEADAAVTSVPGTVLAVLTADCLPVVLAARDGGEVGVAHAGWRGLAEGVLEAIQRDLLDDSLVFRYSHDHDDGLDGIEGTFNMCSFWYVECLARAGDLNQARFLFEKMLGYANHLGLFAEETGASGEQLGNFPQGLSHLGLISTARLIALGDEKDVFLE